MKKIFIFIIVIMLTGCTFYHEEGIDNIKSPQKKYYSMDGKWRLVDKIDLKDESDKEVVEKWKYAFFKENILFLGDIYGENITYRLKNVDSTDYLLYKYRTIPEKLNIDNKKLDIISIYDGEKFITEIIKINNDEFIFSKSDEFYFYKREYTNISKKDIENYIGNNTVLYSEINSLEATGNIGLIIGIKKPVQYKERIMYSYRTEYIQILDNNKIKSFNKEDILLPRKNGFYKLEINPMNLYGDEIRLKYLEQPSEEVIISSNYIKNILYIGNDYMSVENISSKNYKNLRMYPIDYLMENRFVKLGDILDEKSYERVVMDIKNSKDSDIKKKFREENFGLIRRNGYWTLFGRINYKGKERNLYKDFNIRAVTPKTIVNFDELPILWNEIKWEIPNIIDGFISPKKDYLVARMKDEIRVYPIYNNRIDANYIYSTKIDSDESIIMAEWATNIYSEMWAKYFLGDNDD